MQRFRAPVALVAVVGLLMAACSGTAVSSASAQSASSSAVASAASSADGPTEVFNGSISVTSDRDLRVKCFGEGTPTILLEAGGSASMDDWPIAFVHRLAESNTTCLYSRAGGPGSTPLDGMATHRQVVDDAFTLLDMLREGYGVSPPYLFVGWSLGGVMALAEALEHPELTAGMVILDTGFPVDFWKVCAEGGRSEAECQAIYDADEEAKSIEADIVAAFHPMPEIPVAVVSAMLIPECRLEDGATSVSYDYSGTILTASDCEALATLIADKSFADWSQLGPQVTETRVQATHNGLPDEAEDEIVGIVADVLARGDGTYR